MKPQHTTRLDSSICQRPYYVQGHRQALDEKLATSDIQLFGRPAGAPGSRHLNGHAGHAAGVQLADDSGADTDASDEDEMEDENAGMTPGRRGVSYVMRT